MAISDKVITYKAENKVLKYIIIGLISLLSAATIAMSVLFIVVPRGGGTLEKAIAVSLTPDKTNMRTNETLFLDYKVEPDTASSKEVEFVGMRSDGKIMVDNKEIATVSFADVEGVRKIKIVSYDIETSAPIEIKVASKTNPNIQASASINIAKKYPASVNFLKSESNPSVYADSLTYLKSKDVIDFRKAYVRLQPEDVTETDITVSVTDNKNEETEDLTVYGGKLMVNEANKVYAFNLQAHKAGKYNIEVVCATKAGTNKVSKKIPVQIMDSVHSVKFYGSDGNEIESDGELVLNIGESRDISKIIKIFALKEAGAEPEEVDEADWPSFIDGIGFTANDTLVVSDSGLKEKDFYAKKIVSAPAFIGSESSKLTFITAIGTYQSNIELGRLHVRIKVPVNSISMPEGQSGELLIGGTVNMRGSVFSSYGYADPYNKKLNFAVKNYKRDGTLHPAGSVDEFGNADNSTGTNPVVKIERTGSDNNSCKITAMGYGTAVIRMYADDTADGFSTTNTNLYQEITVTVSELAISLDGGANFLTQAAVNVQVGKSYGLTNYIYILSSESPRTYNYSYQSTVSIPGGGTYSDNEYTASLRRLDIKTKGIINLTLSSPTNQKISGTISFVVNKYNYVTNVTIGKDAVPDDSYYDVLYYNDTDGSYNHYENGASSESDEGTIGGYDVYALLNYSFADKTAATLANTSGVGYRIVFKDGTGAETDATEYLAIDNGKIVIKQFSDKNFLIIFSITNPAASPAGNGAVNILNTTGDSIIPGEWSGEVVLEINMKHALPAPQITSIYQETATGVYSYSDDGFYLLEYGKTYKVEFSLGTNASSLEDYEITASGAINILSIDKENKFLIITGKEPASEAGGNSDINKGYLSFNSLRTVRTTLVSLHRGTESFKTVSGFAQPQIKVGGVVSTGLNTFTITQGVQYTLSDFVLYDSADNLLPLSSIPKDVEITASVTNLNPANILTASFNKTNGLVITGTDTGDATVVLSFNGKYKYASSFGAAAGVDESSRTININLHIVAATNYKVDWDKTIDQGASTTVSVTRPEGNTLPITYTLKDLRGNAILSKSNALGDDIITAGVSSTGVGFTVTAELEITEYPNGLDKSGNKQTPILITVNVNPITVDFDIATPILNSNKLYPNDGTAENETITFTSTIANINSNITCQISYEVINPAFVSKVISRSDTDYSNYWHKAEFTALPNNSGGYVTYKVTYTFSLKSTTGWETTYTYTTTNSYTFEIVGVAPEYDVGFKYGTNGTENTSGFIVNAGDKFELKVTLDQSVALPTDSSSFAVTTSSALVTSMSKDSEGVYNSDNNKVVSVTYKGQFLLDTVGGTAIFDITLILDGRTYSSKVAVTVNPLVLSLTADEALIYAIADEDLPTGVKNTSTITISNPTGNGLPTFTDYSVDKDSLAEVTGTLNANPFTVKAITKTFGGKVTVTVTTTGGVTFTTQIEVYIVDFSAFTVTVNSDKASLKQNETANLSYTLTYSGAGSAALNTEYTDLFKTVTSETYSYNGIGSLGSVSGTTFTATNIGAGGSLVINGEFVITGAVGSTYTIYGVPRTISVSAIDIELSASVLNVAQGNSITFSVNGTNLAASSTGTVTGITLAATTTLGAVNNTNATAPIFTANTVVISGGVVEITATITVRYGESGSYEYKVFTRYISITVDSAGTPTFSYTANAESNNSGTALASGTSLGQGSSLYLFMGITSPSGGTIDNSTVVYTSSNIRLLTVDGTAKNKVTAVNNTVGGSVTVKAVFTVEGIEYERFFTIQVAGYSPSFDMAGGSTDILITATKDSDNTTQFNYWTDAALNQDETITFAVVDTDETVSPYYYTGNYSTAPYFRIISGTALATIDSATGRLTPVKYTVGGKVIISVTIYPEGKAFTYNLTVNIAAISLDITNSDGNNISGAIAVVSGGSVAVKIKPSGITAAKLAYEIISGDSKLVDSGVTAFTDETNYIEFLLKATAGFGGTVKIKIIIKDAASNVIGAYNVIGTYEYLEYTIAADSNVSSITVGLTAASIEIAQGEEKSAGLNISAMATDFSAAVTSVVNGNVTFDNSAKKVTAAITGSKTLHTATVNITVTVTAPNGQTKEYPVVLTVNVAALTVTLTAPASLEGGEDTTLSYSVKSTDSTNTTTTLTLGGTAVFSIKSGSDFAEIYGTDNTKLKAKPTLTGGSATVLLTITVSGIELTAEAVVNIKAVQPSFTVIIVDEDEDEIPGAVAATTTSFDFDISVSNGFEFTLKAIEVISANAEYIIDEIDDTTVSIVEKTMGGMVTFKITVSVEIDGTDYYYYIYRDVTISGVAVADMDIAFTKDGTGINIAQVHALYLDSQFIIAATADVNIESISYTLSDSSIATATPQADNKSIELKQAIAFDGSDRPLFITAVLSIDGKLYTKTLMFSVQSITLAYSGVTTLAQDGNDETMSVNITKGYSTTPEAATKVVYSIVADTNGLIDTEASGFDTGSIVAKTGTIGGRVRLMATVTITVAGEEFNFIEYFYIDIAEPAVTFTVANLPVTPVAEINQGAILKLGNISFAGITECTNFGLVSYTIVDGKVFATKTTKDDEPAIQASINGGGTVTIDFVYQIDGKNYTFTRTLRIKNIDFTIEFSNGEELEVGDSTELSVELEGIVSGHGLQVEYKYVVVRGNPAVYAQTDAEFTALPNYKADSDDDAYVLEILVYVTIKGVTYTRTVEITIKSLDDEVLSLLIVGDAATEDPADDIFSGNQTVALSIGGLSDEAEDAADLSAYNETYFAKVGTGNYSVTPSAYRFELNTSQQTITFKAKVTIYNKTFEIEKEVTVVPLNIALTPNKSTITPGGANDASTIDFALSGVELTGTDTVKYVFGLTGTDASKLAYLSYTEGEDFVTLIAKDNYTGGIVSVTAEVIINNRIYTLSGYCDIVVQPSPFTLSILIDGGTDTVFDSNQAVTFSIACDNPATAAAIANGDITLDIDYYINGGTTPLSGSLYTFGIYTGSAGAVTLRAEITINGSETPVEVSYPAISVRVPVITVTTAADESSKIIAHGESLGIKYTVTGLANYTGNYTLSNDAVDGALVYATVADNTFTATYGTNAQKIVTVGYEITIGATTLSAANTLAVTITRFTPTITFDNAYAYYGDDIIFNSSCPDIEGGYSIAYSITGGDTIVDSILNDTDLIGIRAKANADLSGRVEVRVTYTVNGFVHTESAIFGFYKFEYTIDLKNDNGEPVVEIVLSTDSKYGVTGHSIEVAEHMYIDDAGSDVADTGTVTRNVKLYRTQSDWYLTVEFKGNITIDGTTYDVSKQESYKVTAAAIRAGITSGTGFDGNILTAGETGELTLALSRAAADTGYTLNKVAFSVVSGGATISGTAVYSDGNTKAAINVTGSSEGIVKVSAEYVLMQYGFIVGKFTAETTFFVETAAEKAFSFGYVSTDTFDGNTLLNDKGVTASINIDGVYTSYTLQSVSYDVFGNEDDIVSWDVTDNEIALTANNKSGTITLRAMFIIKHTDGSTVTCVLEDKIYVVGENIAGIEFTDYTGAEFDGKLYIYDNDGTPVTEEVVAGIAAATEFEELLTAAGYAVEYVGYEITGDADVVTADEKTGGEITLTAAKMGVITLAITYKVYNIATPATEQEFTVYTTIEIIERDEFTFNLTADILIDDKILPDGASIDISGILMTGYTGDYEITKIMYHISGNVFVSGDLDGDTDDVERIITVTPTKSGIITISATVELSRKITGFSVEESVITFTVTKTIYAVYYNSFELEADAGDIGFVGVLAVGGTVTYSLAEDDEEYTIADLSFSVSAGTEETPEEYTDYVVFNDNDGIAEITGKKTGIVTITASFKITAIDGTSISHSISDTIYVIGADAFEYALKSSEEVNITFDNNQDVLLTDESLAASINVTIGKYSDNYSISNIAYSVHSGAASVTVVTSDSSKIVLKAGAITDKVTIRATITVVETANATNIVAEYYIDSSFAVVNGSIFEIVYQTVDSDFSSKVLPLGKSLDAAVQIMAGHDAYYSIGAIGYAVSDDVSSDISYGYTLQKLSADSALDNGIRVKGYASGKAFIEATFTISKNGTSIAEYAIRDELDVIGTDIFEFGTINEEDATFNNVLRQGNYVLIENTSSYNVTYELRTGIVANLNEPETDNSVYAQITEGNKITGISKGYVTLVAVVELDNVNSYRFIVRSIYIAAKEVLMADGATAVSDLILLVGEDIEIGVEIDNTVYELDGDITYTVTQGDTYVTDKADGSTPDTLNFVISKESLTDKIVLKGLLAGENIKVKAEFTLKYKNGGGKVDDFSIENSFTVVNGASALLLEINELESSPDFENGILQSDGSITINLAATGYTVSVISYKITKGSEYVIFEEMPAIATFSDDETDEIVKIVKPEDDGSIILTGKKLMGRVELQIEYTLAKDENAIGKTYVYEYSFAVVDDSAFEFDCTAEMFDNKILPLNDSVEVRVKNFQDDYTVEGLVENTGKIKYEKIGGTAGITIENLESNNDVKLTGTSSGKAVIAATFTIRHKGGDVITAYTLQEEFLVVGNDLFDYGTINGVENATFNGVLLKNESVEIGLKNILGDYTVSTVYKLLDGEVATLPEDDIYSSENVSFSGTASNVAKTNNKITLTAKANGDVTIVAVITLSKTEQEDITYTITDTISVIADETKLFDCSGFETHEDHKLVLLNGDEATIEFTFGNKITAYAIDNITYEIKSGEGYVNRTPNESGITLTGNGVGNVVIKVTYSVTKDEKTRENCTAQFSFAVFNEALVKFDATPEVGSTFIDKVLLVDDSVKYALEKNTEYTNVGNYEITSFDYVITQAEAYVSVDRTNEANGEITLTGINSDKVLAGEVTVTVEFTVKFADVEVDDENIIGETIIKYSLADTFTVVDKDAYEFEFAKTIDTTTDNILMVGDTISAEVKSTYSNNGYSITIDYEIDDGNTEVQNYFEELSTEGRVSFKGKATGIVPFTATIKITNPEEMEIVEYTVSGKVFVIGTEVFVFESEYQISGVYEYTVGNENTIAVSLNADNNVDDEIAGKITEINLLTIEYYVVNAKNVESLINGDTELLEDETGDFTEQARNSTKLTKFKLKSDESSIIIRAVIRGMEIEITYTTEEEAA